MNHCSRRRRRFAGRIPERSAAADRENLPAAASRCPLPPSPMSVAGGWPEVPPSVQSSTTCKWLNDPTCVPGLEIFFLGFWELKRVLWG